MADKKNARGVGTPEWGSNADADRTIIEAVATLNGLPPLLMAAVGVMQHMIPGSGSGIISKHCGRIMSNYV